MASPTPNKGMTYPAHGGAVDAWDTPLNQNFDQLDQNVGGSYNIILSSTTAAVTYNSSHATAPSTVSALTLGSTGVAQNLNYVVQGTIAANLTISFPGVGGFYGITNDSSGAFSLTVNTVTAGSSGSVIAQGARMFVLADGTNVRQADTSAFAKFYSYMGNPNGSVAGTEATVNGGLTDAVWDVTNQQLYVTTTTGSTATTVWTPQLARVAPQGFLTANSTIDNLVITADVTATTLYYTPDKGNFIPISDGTTIYLRTFGQLSLALTATQAANQIYDVYVFPDTNNVIRIGTGPSWSAGTAGSVTAGACARGTGVGGSAIQRMNGIWVNTAAMTMTNGVDTYAVSALCGTVVGSIFIDSTQGQTTCNTAYGLSRKWGIWNFYNRKTIEMRAGTATGAAQANTSFTTVISSNNFANVFTGLAEEPWIAQSFIGQAVLNVNSYIYGGIGVNNTGAASGFTGNGTLVNGAFQSMSGAYQSPPTFGLQTVYHIGRNDGGGTTTYSSLGETTNLMIVRYQG